MAVDTEDAVLRNRERMLILLYIWQFRKGDIFLQRLVQDTMGKKSSESQSLCAEGRCIAIVIGRCFDQGMNCELALLMLGHILRESSDN